MINFNNLSFSTCGKLCFSYFLLVDGRIRIRTNIGKTGSGRPKNLGTLDPTFHFLLFSFILKHNIYTGSRDAEFLFAVPVSSFPTLVMGQDHKIPFILLFAVLSFRNLGDGCHNVHGCGDEITGQAESSVE
jgi:hypothetical protein